MNVCEVWLADDALTAAGFEVTARGDRRTATRDGVTYLLDGVCRCPVEDCPPHRPAGRPSVPVMPWEVAA